MVRGATLAALVVGLAACRPHKDASPPLPEGTRSVLWAVEEGGSWRIQAADLDPAAPWRFSQTLAVGTSLVVLAYRDSLFALGLTEGPLTLDSGPHARPLPEPASILAGEVDDGDRLAWRSSEDLPRGLDAFRIAAFDVLGCVDSGACLDQILPLGRCSPCAAPRVAAPEPPVAPTLTPCPPGWSMIGTSTVAVCEPGDVPAAAPACPEGEARAPGAAACTRIGRACGDRFAEAPGGSSPVYVDRAAAAGGDGSRSRPFDRLAPALGGPVGAVVLLAAGRYEAPASLGAGDMLIGACAVDVRVQGASVEVRAPQVHLQNLVLSAAVQVGRDGALTVDGADLTGAVSVAEGGAIRVRDAHLRSGLSVAGEADLAATELGGAGIAATGRVTVDQVRVRYFDVGVAASGATLTGSGLVLEDGATGLFVEGDAQVDIDAVVVRRTTAGAIRVTAGSVQLDAVHVFDAEGTAVTVEGGDARMNDGLITDLGPAADGEGGWGVRVTGGRFAGRRMRIERVTDVGVEAFGLDALVELQDTVIAHVPASPTGPGRPAGANAWQGGGLSLERVVIRDVVRHGISTSSELAGPQVLGHDVVVEDVRGRPGGTKGEGIVGDDGASVSLQRVRISRARGFGIALKDAQTIGTLSDVVVEDTALTTCDENDCQLGNGIGIAVSEAAAMELVRFNLRNNADIGLRSDATLGVNVSDGEVEGHRLGVWNTDSAVDLDGLVERVVFRDNQRNVLDER